ncbi:MAG: hypothetical protein QNL07_06340 [Candidatus Planktophila sp.]|jgi:hypothetical protein|tara:strand:+ start:520 stop:1200 length:681 start_codon:yes stop_codon:yes gene_type:complete
MGSPLEGSLSSGFGNKNRNKSKFLLGAVFLAAIPLFVSTFAASVTVGTGSLEFGQGSQQATACDDTVFVAMGEEWHANPSPIDSSDGFFRVRAVTVSNLNLVACAGKKLRIRLIDGQSAEITLGPTEDSKVIQMYLPAAAPDSNISDPIALGLSYLTGIGGAISTPIIASSSLSVSGTAVYDGSILSNTNADATFYLDPAAVTVNIDGQSVRRTTVETVDNPRNLG